MLPLPYTARLLLPVIESVLAACSDPAFDMLGVEIAKEPSEITLPWLPMANAGCVVPVTL